MADKTVEENKEEPVSASASKHSGKRLPRKRLILFVAILAVVVAVLWYGIDWWIVGRFIEKTDDAYVGGNVTVISPHVSCYVAGVREQAPAGCRAGVWMGVSPGSISLSRVRWGK